ncbi:MAG: insulinase family protein, partial [Planctomycetes bacterium]|nr:insulinase family protein [Planctomycetota bacterium]
MRRRIRLALLVALISACWLTAEAQSLKLDVQEHTLKNGMKVLMLERHKTPTVACRINFRVGSSDERPGITGISHFLEHMMFKGTKIVGIKDFAAEQKLVAREEKLVAAIEAEEVRGEKADKAKLDGLRKELDALRQEWRKLIVKDELWATYLKHGASGLNASTGDDATYYYCDLPSNKLELWAFLESDRMRNPVLREFYSERDVIKEERRMRVDNSPFGVLFEQLGATAFIAHPYGWPTIGWMSDISSLRKD